MSERTLAIIKPDSFQRGLVGQILHRYERKGLKLVALKLLYLSRMMMLVNLLKKRKHFSNGLK